MLLVDVDLLMRSCCYVFSMFVLCWFDVVGSMLRLCCVCVVVVLVLLVRC